MSIMKSIEPCSRYVEKARRTASRARHSSPRTRLGRTPCSGHRPGRRPRAPSRTRRRPSRRPASAAAPRPGPAGRGRRNCPCRTSSRSSPAARLRSSAARDHRRGDRTRGTDSGRTGPSWRVERDRRAHVIDEGRPPVDRIDQGGSPLVDARRVVQVDLVDRIRSGEDARKRFAVGDEVPPLSGRSATRTAARLPGPCS